MDTFEVKLASKMKVFFDFVWLKNIFSYLCKSNGSYRNNEYYLVAYEVL